MVYYGKIKTLPSGAVLSYYGESGHEWKGNPNAGRTQNRDLETMSFEEIYNKAVNLKRSFVKKLKVFDETIDCNEKSYRDYGMVKKGKNNSMCRTKMLTITFEEDIQTKGEAYKEFNRVCVSLEKRIAKYCNLDKYKICGIGVYERHKENRTGYHIHLIAFNIPYMDKKYYTWLKDYVKDNLRAMIKIDAPSDHVKYDEFGDIVVDGVKGVRSYVKKTFNYLKKQFNLKADLFNEDGLFKSPDLFDTVQRINIMEYLKNILPDLTQGKTFVKRGKLKKPTEVLCDTHEEYLAMANKIVKSGEYRVEALFEVNSYIPIRFVYLIKTLFNINSVLNISIMEFLSRIPGNCRYTGFDFGKVKYFTEVGGIIIKEE